MCLHIFVVLGVNPDAVRIILDYIYHRNLKLSKDNVVDVIVCADFFQMDNLVGLAVDFMRGNLNGEQFIF